MLHRATVMLFRTADELFPSQRWNTRGASRDLRTETRPALRPATDPKSITENSIYVKNTIYRRGGARRCRVPDAAVEHARFAVAKQNKVNFTVRIENISAKDGLVAADGSRYPFALSPGFYAVNDGKLALFEAGKRASAGLEAQAEDGMPDLLSMFTVARGSDGSYGVFSKPVGASMAGPILPEGIYESSEMPAKAVCNAFNGERETFAGPSVDSIDFRAGRSKIRPGVKTTVSRRITL